MTGQAATPEEQAAGISDDSLSLEEYLKRLPKIRRGDTKTLKALRMQALSPQDTDRC